MPSWGDGVESIHSRIDARWASGRFGTAQNGDPSSDGRSAIWTRSPEGLEVSAALLAVLADWMPSGIGHALGVWAGGNSLDNTIRIICLVPTEWVLCEIHVDGVFGGFGHVVDIRRHGDGDGIDLLSDVELSIGPPVALGGRQIPRKRHLQSDTGFQLAPNDVAKFR